MFIYTISNDIYHDKVLKPSVVTIRRLPNDKEAIHNNIRILIVYRTETRIFVTHMLRTRVRKKLFTDERKLK